MEVHSLLENALVFLGAGIVGVFVFKKLGLGSVLGYLATGTLIGPFALGLIDRYEDTLHFAEFGVVFLLFIIGLELSPKRLWQFRHATLGFGSLQVFTTGAIFAVLLVYFFDFSVSLSLLLGFGFSLSSTAMVLQVLSERDELSTSHGQLSFGTLLFQDIAAIPLIALVPVLAAKSGSDVSMQQIFIGVGAVIGIIIAGIYTTEPILRNLAKLRVNEVLLAASLTIVLGLAFLMEKVGLSMALGAFLGGVVLSNSSYKHQLEKSLEPFKSLLMGLFFIAVGMSIDLGLAYENLGLVLSLLLGILIIKFFLIGFLARFFFKKSVAESFNTGANLCQSGEFVFIVLTLISANQLLANELVSVFKITVGLSMLLTPPIIQLVRFLASRSYASTPSGPSIDEDMIHPGSDIQPDCNVFVVGYGRFGQIASRIFKLKKIDLTIFDNNPDHIRFVRKFGSHVYYGDAQDYELLRKAGIEKAKLIIIAIDQVDVSKKIIKEVKENIPEAKIFARARNRQHLLALRQLGVDYCIRDTYMSALEFTREALQAVGLDYSSASSAVSLFREHDERILEEQLEHGEDVDKLSAITRKWTVDMEKLLEADEKSEH